jgi:mannose-6-phosphate isomerase-like protein (cupin superfamily)
MLHRFFWPAVALALAASTAMASDIRRIVTGLDANNRAVVLFDSRLPLAPRAYGVASTVMWITDSYPPALSFTKDDPATRPIGIPPPDNGTIFRVVEFLPLDAAAEAKMEPELLMKSIGDHAPARGLPVKHPMMHRSRTVDYAVVLSGEIDMMLDETSVHLKPGDTVVQQATNHAWINRGKEPCRILFVLMDSKQP